MQFPIELLKQNNYSKRSIELMFIHGCSEEDEEEIELFGFIMEADLDKYLDKETEYEVVNTTQLRDQ